VNAADATLPLPFLCLCCQAPLTAYTPACPKCGRPNAVREVRSTSLGRIAGGPPLAPAPPPERPMPMSARTVALPRIKIGVGNVDAAFGGGMVEGSAILLSGESGAGKSTLALRLAEAIGKTALYVGSEELREQIEDRATRIGCGLGIPLYCSADLDDILSYAPDYKAIFVDSLHALRGDLKQNAKRLVTFCRQHRAVVLCIARWVKDGTIEGAASIPYDFDVDITLEKNLAPDGSTSRSIRTGVKNRFGVAGCWPLYMNERGWMDPPIVPEEAP
jgi:DNA repair protein RadA/Sms